MTTQTEKLSNELLLLGAPFARQRGPLAARLQHHGRALAQGVQGQDEAAMLKSLSQIVGISVIMAGDLHADLNDLLTGALRQVRATQTTGGEDAVR